MSETLFPTPVEGDDEESYSISDDMTPRKLRRSTAKEELVALTGDLIDAILLNQMLKYQAQSRDREAYIEEERRRMAARGQTLNLPRSRGFFYKKADELAMESMVTLHKTNIGKRLKKFEAKGWCQHRRNPDDPFDYTYQYRMEVVEIDRQLKAMGFPGLDGWLISRITPDILPPQDGPQPRSSETQLRESEAQSGSSGTPFRGSKGASPSKVNKEQQQGDTKQGATNMAIPRERDMATPSTSTTQAETLIPPAVPSVDAVLEKFNDVVVVEVDDEADDPNPRDGRYHPVVKEMLEEGISLVAAEGILNTFGEAKAREAMDDPRILDQLYRELRDRSSAPPVQKETGGAAGGRSSAPSPIPAGAVRSMPSVGPSDSEVEERMAVLIEMQEAAPNMETRVAQKAIEEWGPLRCRLALIELPGLKADDKAAMLMWAIRNLEKVQNKKRGSAALPREETREEAIARSESNRAHELTEQQKWEQKQKDDARMDALWPNLSEKTRMKIEQVVVKRLGPGFDPQRMASAFLAERREMQRAANAGNFGKIYEELILNAAPEAATPQEGAA